jgi:pyruvate/2-oxoglutarate dehydrogenase complex dihydrolipoamide acyltransferase (E2) component
MTNVHIPKAGMSTVEVDVTAVLVQPGDRVEAGQPLIEVESEKVTFEIEAQVTGVVVEVRVSVGDVREVGEVVVVLDETG